MDLHSRAQLNELAGTLVAATVSFTVASMGRPRQEVGDG